MCSIYVDINNLVCLCILLLRKLRSRGIKVFNIIITFLLNYKIILPRLRKNYLLTVTVKEMSYANVDIIYVQRRLLYERMPSWKRGLYVAICSGSEDILFLLEAGKVMLFPLIQDDVRDVAFTKGWWWWYTLESCKINSS